MTAIDRVDFDLRNEVSAGGRELSAPRISSRQLLWTGAVVMQLAVIGAALASIIGRLSIGQYSQASNNVFYHLYAHHEQWLLLLIAGSVLALCCYCVLRGGSNAPGTGISRARARVITGGTAIAVFCATYLGHRVVMHSFPLSMDEYNAVFQSEIFAAGKVAARVPPEWRGIAPAITPYFVSYRPDRQSWQSGYLPVYAAARAAFLKARVASALNPILAALAILLIASVARRLWPDDPGKELAAVLLLGTSSQFLAMSMSSYSMPAHLFLNLVWVWLYLDAFKADGSRAWVAMPWVGVLALGLHNPFPHALFVTPFLVRLLRSGRPWVTAYFAIVYAAGSAAWATWLNQSFSRLGRVGMLDVFGLPGTDELLTQVMSLTLVLSWQTPVFALAVAIALANWRQLSHIEQDLAAGVLLTFAFYLFFPTSQGHGWGYRYVYNVLGSAALLGTVGLAAMSRQYGRVRVAQVLVASVAVTVIVQVPVRVAQIREFVRPFAAAVDHIKSTSASAVVIHTAASWYGQDLVRNDPFLRPPVIISASSRRFGATEWSGLESRLGPALKYVPPAELERRGMRTVRTVR